MTGEIIFITDEMSWDAVIREGVDELTEEEARAEFERQGIELDGTLRRQAYLEGDATKSDYDRIFYPVEEIGHSAAFIGWVHE